MGRPRKENSLTKHDVIAAAIACLEQEGESALGVNRVARKLNIKPPAIYKHLEGNAGLRRAVALAIWRQYLAECQQKTAGITDLQELFRRGARTTRSFARSHPALYRVMMHYQMRPTDSEEAEVMQDSLKFFQTSLHLQGLKHHALIDVMRMVNAAIYGFIMREQSELMTIDRSTDESYEVMLEALLVAIAHIQQINSCVTVNSRP